MKATTNPALLQWILGRQYPVIGTDFYFMALRDESKLRECVHRLAVPPCPYTLPLHLFLSFFCLLVSAVAGLSPLNVDQHPKLCEGGCEGGCGCEGERSSGEPASWCSEGGRPAQDEGEGEHSRVLANPKHKTGRR